MLCANLIIIIFVKNKFPILLLAQSVCIHVNLCHSVQFMFSQYNNNL